MTGKFLFMRYLVFRTDKYPVSAAATSEVIIRFFLPL